MAAHTLQAGSAPANAPLAPDTFTEIASDAYIQLGHVEALFEGIAEAVSSIVSDDTTVCRYRNMADAFATLGGDVSSRLSKLIERVEVAGMQFARESR